MTEGNPNLRPEYTDNYELTYNTFMKGTTLNFSGFYRGTTGSIQSIRTARQDTLYTTYQNIGKENAYGLNFFGNVSIGKKFSLNGGTDAYYAMLNNNLRDSLNIKNSGFVFSGRLFGNYTLKNGWGFQFFSFFRGKNVNLQGYQGGFRMYSLSLRKEFKNKKGSIGFGAENFVTPTMKIKNEVQSTTFSPLGTTTTLNQNSTNIMYNLSFRVNFSYRIGKMSFENNTRVRKKSVNNDDLKDGGGGDNQGGSAEQGQQRTGTQPQMGGRQQQGGGKTTVPVKPAEEKKKNKKKN